MTVIQCVRTEGDQPGNGIQMPNIEGNDADRDLADEAYGQFEDFFDAVEAKAMALVLSTMMQPGIGLACLSDKQHASGKVLWQQKVGI